MGSGDGEGRPCYVPPRSRLAASLCRTAAVPPLRTASPRTAQPRTGPTPQPGSPPATPPTFAAALGYWLRLGLTSFGGPAGQIAMMQTEIVDRRKWLDQRRFLDALNFCMMLPGPEAQQLCTYVGWRLHGIAGGLAAGLSFILPGAVVLWVLSYLAAAHGELAAVGWVFVGIQPVVVAIIAVAVWRIGRRTLHDPLRIGLAAGAFAGLHLAGLPFPLIVALAAFAGMAGARLGWITLPPPEAHSGPPPRRRSPWRVPLLVGLFALLWAVPVALLLVLFGPTPYRGVVELFTTAAFVTFGGAYAVLPYIAQAAVETYGWLGPVDMVRGLALAETTPGPLILVTQFIGFFAGWGQPGALSPLAAATLATVVTLYVTFLPCFLFIFAGAPYIEAIGRSRLAAAALAGITAAVVGVIATLGVFIAEAALFGESGRPDVAAIAIALAAALALLRFKVGVHWMVAAGALAGIAQGFVAGAL
ncbi:MAG: chromate efflux transporter [Rhodospirillaceae bacterium]|nr:chromate efflux transporter [Rhodospirillaceae bacterium]